MFMWRFPGIGMDCLSSMLILTPLALLILKLSGRKLLSLHTFFLLLYLAALAGIYSVTGIPDVKDCRIDFTLNLIPMADILSSPMQYVLNVLMFLPVGFLLPLLFDEYQDWKYVLGFGCFLTVFIEVSQIFTFRTTDIDDLITNLLGAGTGYWLVHAAAGKMKLRLPFGIENDYEEQHGQWVYPSFCSSFLYSPTGPRSSGTRCSDIRQCRKLFNRLRYGRCWHRRIPPASHVPGRSGMRSEAP